MIRKTPLVLIGAAAGAVLTVMATQPRTVFDLSSAKAATVDAYRQLTLFGDVFERVRSDYVERPDDGSSSSRRSTACWPGSIPIRAIWTPRAFAICRWIPVGNLVGSE